MRLSTRWLWFLPVAASLWLAPAASAVSIDWVSVGDPGNAADSTGFGGVAYTYRISKYEVTNAQYAEFLSAKAPSYTLGLYTLSMGSGLGGIIRNGSPGTYTYSLIAGRENMPVTFVSFYSTLRFANWLNNGRGNGDTEPGAYTLLSEDATPTNGLTVTRNADASVFLASEDEWYKAAYYDPLSASYFSYPTGTDAQTVCAAPGATANTANCHYLVNDLTEAGSYTASTSPYGTFDQGGNVMEWNESIISGSYRSVRGGSLLDDPGYLASSERLRRDPARPNGGIGFRVASLIPVPEPGTGLLVAMGVIGLVAWSRTQRRGTCPA